MLVDIPHALIIPPPAGPYELVPLSIHSGMSGVDEFVCNLGIALIPAVEMVLGALHLEGWPATTAQVLELTQGSRSQRRNGQKVQLVSSHRQLSGRCGCSARDSAPFPCN